MKKGFAKIILIFVLAAVFQVAPGCRNAQTADASGAQATENKKDAPVSAPLDELENSVDYNVASGILSFTVPENIAEGQKLYIHVSGRLLDGSGGGMSWHAFETETENNAWIPGHMYEAQIDPEILDSITVTSQILSSEGDILAEKTIEADAKGNIISN